MLTEIVAREIVESANLPPEFRLLNVFETLGIGIDVSDGAVKMVLLTGEDPGADCINGSVRALAGFISEIHACWHRFEAGEISNERSIEIAAERMKVIDEVGFATEFWQAGFEEMQTWW